MVRVGILSVLLTLLGLVYSPAQANDDLKRQEALLGKRADLQQQIQDAQRRLHQVEVDRNDKLEELDQLYRARADLDRRHTFSKDIENEIVDQSRNLHVIEVQRSDCLEEMDGLYSGLSQINRDIAGCNR